MTKDMIRKDIKVEWFLARERYRRWDEEVLWLKREAASVIYDFEHRRRSWTKSAQEAKDINRLGLWGYCNRQAHLWNNLREDAVQRTYHMLEHSTGDRNLAICIRAMKDYGPGGTAGN
ncbi:hypothetical protein BDV93DRAFT_563440 [Ceratobasidium sp. AG-I]|nr:hypothetical protein BDV93DRAFT_563440 [Ceratobasidium sp. AG-I]